MPLEDQRRAKAKRLLKGAQSDLIGTVTGVRFEAYRERVVLTYDDGREVEIVGGGDYCASMEVVIRLRRPALV